MLFGRTRIESQRWVTFRSHYQFDAFYCRPGVEGAHEKGGVEVEGGRFRRNHLVPMPHVDSVAELNELLAAADAKDEARRLEGRTVTVTTDFALEQPVDLVPVGTDDGTVDGVDDAVAAGEQESEVLPTAQADDGRVGHVAGAVLVLVPVEQHR